MSRLNVRLSNICVVPIALMLLLVPLPSAVVASTVGTGTLSSCTEAALDAGLLTGGTVNFNCGPNPVTITVTGQKTIALDTSLDGGGLITISGGGSTRIFLINPGVAATFANLTIRDGFFAGGGGAIGSPWNATVTVANSTFINNRAGIGGAVFFFDSGTLTVTDSTFANNRAEDGPGGAIDMAGALTVTNSTFTNNSATYGGAIDTGNGPLTVTNSTFANNSATSSLYGSGAISIIGGKHSVSNSTFVKNTAVEGNGGAIWTSLCVQLAVTNSTFTDNEASTAGALLVVGGGTRKCGKITVTNSTFANNSATVGGAILSQGSTVICKNTIIANSTSGPNCGGKITDGGHNIDSDRSCGFSSFRGSSTADPQLDPAGLANNGGATQTIAVQPGSPAIGAGKKAVCRHAPVKNLDQRGYARPGTDAQSCTIGAYEFNSPGPPLKPMR